MTTTTSAADRVAADVRQLVDPIHVAVRGRLITHDPLLLQLRDACVPGRGGRSEARRPAPGPRLPAREDALDALLWIYGGLMDWKARLNLSHPAQDADWQVSMMRALVGVAPGLTPAQGHLLASEVRDWWAEAAVWSGWTTTDLMKLR